jgi:hypothetical protein
MRRSGQWVLSLAPCPRDARSTRQQGPMAWRAIACGAGPAHWRAHRLEQVERLDDVVAWRDACGWIRVCAQWKRRRGLVVVATLA